VRQSLARSSANPGCSHLQALRLRGEGRSVVIRTIQVRPSRNPRWQNTTAGKSLKATRVRKDCSLIHSECRALDPTRLAKLIRTHSGEGARMTRLLRSHIQPMYGVWRVTNEADPLIAALNTQKHTRAWPAVLRPKPPRQWLS